MTQAIVVILMTGVCLCRCKGPPGLDDEARRLNLGGREFLRRDCVRRKFTPPASAIDRVLNDDGLVRRQETAVVHTFNASDPARYFSVFEVPSGCGKRRGVLFMGKQGDWPHCARDSWVTVFGDCDASLRDCGGASCLRSGSVVHRDHAVDHNLGCVLVEGGEMVCVGGLLSSPDDETAVLSATVESLSSGGVLRVAGARAITSRHPGCLELRKGKYPDCVFDGRFSLATRGSGETAGEMWLYARANMAPKGGGRSQRRCLLPSEELSSQS